MWLKTLNIANFRDSYFTVYLTLFISLRAYSIMSRRMSGVTTREEFLYNVEKVPPLGRPERRAKQPVERVGIPRLGLTS